MNADHSRRRSRRAGSRGGSGSNAALEDANRYLMNRLGPAAENMNKLDVGLIGKVGMKANLFADLLP